MPHLTLKMKGGLGLTRFYLGTEATEELLLTFPPDSSSVPRFLRLVWHFFTTDAHQQQPNGPKKDTRAARRQV